MELNNRSIENWRF